MKIVSYNVNGIRAAMTKGLVDWVAAGNYDIVCLQETKASPEQVDMTPFEALGYTHYWCSAEKKGYSGVAILTKTVPDQVIYTSGLTAYDKEGRIIRADFGDFTILNCYFPSGTSGDERQDFKIDFLNTFFDYAQALRAARPNLIIVGDYNIAHTENDIHDPKSNKNSTGFLPEEREWLTKWFGSGFSDAFRTVEPSKTEYSWWSYRAGARANNKGWRIDYQSFSESLIGKVTGAYHDNEAKHSDHCPVVIEADL
jgi:exodeoxyribonuclease III